MRLCYSCGHAELLHENAGPDHDRGPCSACVGMASCPTLCQAFDPAPDFHCSPSDREKIDSLCSRIVDLQADVRAFGITVAGDDYVCGRLDDFDKYIDFAVGALADIRDASK